MFDQRAWTMTASLILLNTGPALAQTVEVAEKGLSMLERIQAGGIPLISLCIAAICGVAFYWQLRANQKLHAEALDKAEKRTDNERGVHDTRLKEQEKLLREMLDRDREAQEAQMAATQAVEGFTAAIHELNKTVEAHGFDMKKGHDALLRDLMRRLDDMERAFRGGLKT